MLLYFAYGSNMLAEQMAERCPGAQLAGRGMLPHWRFLITTRGTANIAPHKGAAVHGALWRCSPVHLQTLDEFEGVATGNYLRRRVRLHTHDGRQASALVYTAARLYPGPARPHYLSTAVLPGARALQLPEEYISNLESWLPNRPVGAAQSRYRGRRRR